MAMCGLVWPLHGLVNPFHGIVKPFHGVVKPFHGVVKSFQGLVWPFYRLLWQNIDMIGLLLSFIAVIYPNSFGLIFCKSVFFVTLSTGYKEKLALFYQR